MALQNVVLVDGARTAFGRGGKGKLVATRLDDAGEPDGEAQGYQIVLGEGDAIPDVEAAILEAEAAAEACRKAAEDPAIASDPAALQARYVALEAARAEVDRLYARWAELEDKGETR
jgi:ATP-binding cassette subfamily F protein uup